MAKSRITEKHLNQLGLFDDGSGNFQRRTNVPRPPDVQPQELPEDTPGYLWMPGRVPSSKNHKKIGWRYKAMKGKVQATMLHGAFRRPVTPFITDNDATREYRKKMKAYFMDRKKYFHKMIEGRSMPYVVEMIFVMPHKARFDFHNIVQLPADMMVEYGWIPDDDIHTLLIVPPLPPRQPYVINKERPGMFIRVL